MELAHGKSPERFVRGKPVVKPLPGEVWINNPLSQVVPDANNPENRNELAPKVSSPEAGAPFGNRCCPVIPIHSPIQAGQKRNVHLQLFGLKDVDTFRMVRMSNRLVVLNQGSSEQRVGRGSQKALGCD